MDRLRQTYLLIVIGFLFGFSQNNKNDINISDLFLENVYATVNTTTLLCGEKLFYKVYCLNPINNSESNLSKIAYIELIEKNKKSILKQKINLENGKGFGDIFIPTTLETGNYKLICYTNLSLNNLETSFYEIDIFIINPFIPINNQTEEKLNIENPRNNYDDLQNKNFSLKLSKKIFDHREKVIVEIDTIQNHMNKSSFSVSVRKVEKLPLKKQMTSADFSLNSSKTEYKTTSNQIKFIPEIRGEIVSGFINSKSKTTDLENKLISLSIPGKSFGVKIVKTDKFGKFSFILDKYPSETNSIIQVLGEDRSDFSIQLETTNTPDLKNLKFSDNLFLNPTDKSLIEEHSVANQIENAYYENKTDSLFTEPISNPFYHTNEKNYILDDYTRFSTLKETITEVLTEIYSKKSNGKYSMFLRNDNIDLSRYGKPLILVDGIVIQDESELFDYNPNNIYKVSVINKLYIYGPKMFAGIISFITKNNDFQIKSEGDYLKKTALIRPQNSKHYFSPDYYNSNGLERIPDYRYQLYWNPNLEISSNTNSFTFFTSDISGLFEIVVDGFNEKGDPLSFSKIFEVK